MMEGSDLKLAMGNRK